MYSLSDGVEANRCDTLRLSRDMLSRRAIWFGGCLGLDTSFDSDKVVLYNSGIEDGRFGTDDNRE